VKRDHFTVVGLGELLWDIFPAGRQLGGAPANFAYITSVLGDCGMVASRLGKDPLGDEAAGQIGRLGLDPSHVQRDASHLTGTVQVSVDAQGQPRFEITEPAAWDFLEWTPNWQSLASETDAVCFGSLAQRSPQSRATVRQFVNAIPPAGLRVFDVNLRQSFYSAQVIRESMQLANIIKLNHEELPQVMNLLGLGHTSVSSSMEDLLQRFELDLVCLTRGENGSVLCNQRSINEHPGQKIDVKDTVGAGDAFTAGLVHGYLRQASLQTMNEIANRMGAWVAGNVGATPPRETAPLRQSLL